jgi:hypothetical protein
MDINEILDILNGKAQDGNQLVIKDTIGDVGNKFGFNPLNHLSFGIDYYDYHPGHITASQLTNDDKQIVLESRYPDKISPDVSEQIWASVGTAIHWLRQKAAEKLSGIMCEARFRANVGEFAVTGQIDAYFIDRQKLDDLKVTTVWTYATDVRHEDYLVQLSIYKWLLESKEKEFLHDGEWIKDPNIYPVTEATITYFLRDWKETGDVFLKGRGKVKAGDIVPVQLVEKPVELWSYQRTGEWLRNRLNRLSVAFELDDARLPPCTRTWANDAKCKKYCPVRAICDKGRQYERK